MTRSIFTFRLSTADSRRQQAQERAQRRRRQLEDRKARRLLLKQRRLRRRQEAKWKKADLKRRRQEDKRTRIERKRWLLQQKRTTLGNGWNAGRSGGQGSPGARRAAHNLLTLANSIGVRFNADDTRQLLEYADRELAGSGEDIYTIYSQLTGMTDIGRGVASVMSRYPVESDGDQRSVMERVAEAGELIGEWEKSNDLAKADELSQAISETLGATPAEIKADQSQLETADKPRGLIGWIRERLGI